MGFAGDRSIETSGVPHPRERTDNDNSASTCAPDKVYRKACCHRQRPTRDRQAQEHWRTGKGKTQLAIADATEATGPLTRRN